MSEIEKLFLNYFSELDEALEVLSHKFEGKISNLPSYVLTKRKINIGLTKDKQGVVLRIIPDYKLNEDTIKIIELVSQNDMDKIFDNFSLKLDIDNLKYSKFSTYQDAAIVAGEGNLAQPIFQDNSTWGSGNLDDCLQFFKIKNPEKAAIDLWNNALSNSPGKYFILEANNIFERLKSLLKRKKFYERKVHRFIYEHSSLLLPSHSNCFFEHTIYFQNQKRKIDLLLERENGLSPILIELENPAHKIIGKNKNFLKMVHHAKKQIAEWVAFIDKDSLRNASGNFSFLSGPKDRMVIIGTGLQYKEILIETKYTDTIIWTYDLLIQQSKIYWNNIIKEQCRLLNIEPFDAFKL